MRSSISRAKRLARFFAWAGIISLPGPSGCWDSDIAKRFREGYAPSAVEGLVAAAADPTSEAGIRQALGAVFEGLGQIIEPRTSSSQGGSN